VERERNGVRVSSKNGLGKLYDRLTPEERFKLDVEATARGDEAESKRLVDTCLHRALADGYHAGAGRGG
jgi:hypothetical protein